MKPSDYRKTKVTGLIEKDHFEREGEFSLGDLASVMEDMDVDITKWTHRNQSSKLLRFYPSTGTLLVGAFVEEEFVERLIRTPDPNQWEKALDYFNAVDLTQEMEQIEISLSEVDIQWDPNGISEDRLKTYGFTRYIMENNLGNKIKVWGRDSVEIFQDLSGNWWTFPHKTRMLNIRQLGHYYQGITGISLKKLPMFR